MCGILTLIFHDKVINKTKNSAIMIVIYNAFQIQASELSRKSNIVMDKSISVRKCPKKLTHPCQVKRVSGIHLRGLALNDLINVVIQPLSSFLWSEAPLMILPKISRHLLGTGFLPSRFKTLSFYGSNI